MKKSKLDSSPVKAEVVKRLAAGESQASIAEDVGLNRSQVSRFANREDIREFIEQEQLRLVEVVPDAVENLKSLVREMKTIPPKEPKRRDLCYKASNDLLNAVGIMPTPLQSPVINNIIHEPMNILIPNAIASIEYYTKDPSTYSEDDFEREKETASQDPEKTPPPSFSKIEYID